MANEWFNTLNDVVLKSLVQGATAGQFVSESGHADVPMARLGQILDQNPLYLHMLQMGDPFKSRRAEEGSQDLLKGERLLAWLGRAAMRNGVLDIRLQRLLRQGLPRSEKDSLTLKPSDKFKRAIQAEEFFQDSYLPFPEMAFLAGLHYDWLSAVFDSRKGIPADLKATLDEVWKESFKTGVIAVKLAVKMKNLPFDRYAFAGAASIGLGKVLMAWLFSKKQGDIPGWKEFDADSEKHKTRKRAYQLLNEKKKFPVTHPELSGLVLSFFGWLRPVEMAVTFYQTPYWLKKSYPDLYRFSSLISIAHTLATQKSATQTLPLMEGEWDRARELGFDEAKIKLALAEKVKGGAKK